MDVRRTLATDRSVSASARASQPISAASAGTSSAVRSAPAARAAWKSGKSRTSASAWSSNTFQATPSGCASTRTAASE